MTYDLNKNTKKIAVLHWTALVNYTVQ